MFRDAGAPEATLPSTVTLIWPMLYRVSPVPSVPQDRVALTEIKPRFLESLDTLKTEGNITSQVGQCLIKDAVR